MGPTDTVATVETWWSEHGYQLLLAAMSVVVLVLAVTLYRARRRGRLDRWVSAVAGIAVLGLSAEGMWVVAVERLHLPPVLAVITFAVFELAMISSAMHATAQYHRTTTRDEYGQIITPGHPGRHGTVVWAIAATAGVIVSLNSSSFVEVLLRLALPVLAAGMWWTTLTSEGTSRPEGTWRWTPRRLLVRLGAIEPNERDLADVTRDRRIAAMTATARRVHREARPRRWHVARLERLALRADDDMIREVQSRVERAHFARDLTAPGTHARAERSDRTDTGAERTHGHMPTSDSGHMPAARAQAPDSVRSVAVADMPTRPATASARPGEQNGHTANGHRPELPDTRDHSTPDRAASAHPRRGSRPRPDDAEVLATYGAQLADEYRTTGRLSEYRVRQVTGLSARPSRRVRDRIVAQADQDHEHTPQQHTSEQTDHTNNDTTDTQNTSTDILEPNTDPFQSTRPEHTAPTIHDTPGPHSETILTQVHA